MGWRVALIDSCGHWPGALEAASFVSVSGRVDIRVPVEDESGHGSDIAQLMMGDSAAAGRSIELLLAQVFVGRAPTTAAAVAAAIDWSISHGANLLHLSLGLAADRAVLRDAAARAIGAGAVMVASVPARGEAVYPAGYPAVIAATGDARCAPGELSQLGPRTFGGYAGEGRGASFGAARVTMSLMQGPVCADASAAAATLAALAIHRGAERRGNRGRASVCL